MALINQAIANLFNGVSQQPPQLRLPSQCEVSENFYPTIAAGLLKRPPTEFKAKLSSIADDSANVTVLSRDTNERYILVLLNGNLEVFDAFTGAKKTVQFPSGKNYLQCSSPKADFSLVTVADNTFIVNKTKTVKMGATVAPTNANKGYVFFTQYGSGVARDMGVTVATGTASVGGSYGGDDSYIGKTREAIRTTLSAGLGSGWEVNCPFANLLRITRLTSAPFEITASDTYGNSTMKVIKGSVAQFADLPTQLDDGYICYISPAPGSDGKGYYVRYETSSKSYVECPKPGVQVSFDASTMPHKLVRKADGTFSLETVEWAKREVGDDSSCPLPTFVGRTINGVFLYRNRLGMLSDENVILSASGDYFNFFSKTATSVIDSDPIDIIVGNTEVSILRHAVPFNKVLMLFSDQTQFQLSGGDTLTPKTAKADPTTSFVSSKVCRPVAAGNELFFVVECDGYSRLREYFVNMEALSDDAAEVTAHVPAYIPDKAFKLSASTSEDVLFVLTEREPNVIYLYKYFWGKEEKAQAAWCRFVFAEGDKVLGCDFISSTAYLVIKRSDGLYLEQMGLRAWQTDEGLPFPVLLDRKVSLVGIYDKPTNKTLFTLPWPAVPSVIGVLSAGFGTQKGALLKLTQESDYQASAQGDYSQSKVFIGVPYTAHFRFSEQYVKDKNNVSITTARVKMRRMNLSFVDTGYFRVEVTPPGRETFTYPFTGKVLGVSGVTLGSPAVSSGSFKFPVLADSRGVQIDLINDTPYPCIFQSAEWEGEVVLRSQRA